MCFSEVRTRFVYDPAVYLNINDICTHNVCENSRKMSNRKFDVLLIEKKTPLTGRGC